jgi:hypothetical protein
VPVTVFIALLSRLVMSDHEKMTTDHQNHTNDQGHLVANSQGGENEDQKQWDETTDAH